MKKMFILMLCTVLLLSGVGNVALAESAMFENDTESELLVCSDEGIERLINPNSNMMRISNKKNDNTDITFSIGKKDKDTKREIISMSGSFEYNGQEFEVEAEGFTKTYKSKIIGNILTGHLKGKIYIEEEERDINVNYEENKNNVYYSITINNLASEEGFAVFSFGESPMDEDVLRELGLLKEDNEMPPNEENMISPMDFDDRVDFDWVGLDNYGGWIARLNLYLEDDIVDYGDDGKMLATLTVDKDEAEQVLEDARNENILAITVREFVVDFDSYDEESSFGNHYPDETDSSSAVFDFILSAMSDIPGMPSSVINAIEYVGRSIGNDIVISYDNDMYRRKFRIEPGDDTYMDWSQYPSGGYPVQIFINKDMTARRDNIDVEFYADLTVYLSQSKRSYIIGTDIGFTTVDLADY